MADILLTHSNHLFADPKQVRKMEPLPPLQTLIAAACLRRQGLSVALFDATFDDPHTAFEHALDREHPRLVAIVEDNFNYLTKMCCTTNREAAIAQIRQARESGAPVVVNGADSTRHPEIYLEEGAAAVALGEVEETLTEAAETVVWSGPAKLEDVEGLALPNGRTAPRKAIVDLDALPDPAWTLAPLERYREARRDAHSRFSVSLAASRGCPYRCNWCSRPIHGSAYQSMSPARAAEQMAAAKNEIGAEHIWFADEIFALRPEWARQFAREVQEHDARLPFRVQSRCGLITPEAAKALAVAGCEEVWMGLESGSQSVLDAMRKDMTVEQAATAAENLRKEGVRACYFLQFGYPGETWDDIQATIDWVKQVRPDEIGVSVSYPLPGTPFHDRVAEQITGKSQWMHSDDQAVLFKGGFSTDFYSALCNAIHLEVDLLNSRAPGHSYRLSQLWREVERLKQAAQSE